MGRDIKGKVITVAAQLPFEVYEEFRKKAVSEGYSLRRALQLLIGHYINDRIKTDGTNQ